MQTNLYLTTLSKEEEYVCVFSVEKMAILIFFAFEELQRNS